MSRIIAVLCFVTLLTGSALAEPPASGPSVPRVPEPKGKRILENFNYRGVTLDGGRLRTQLDQVRADYLRIPNDELLKGFRQRAGLAAPGRDLPFAWSHTELKPGGHTIRLKVLEAKNPKSKARFINVAGFEVLGGAE